VLSTYPKNRAAFRSSSLVGVRTRFRGQESGLALPPTKLKLASSEWDVVSCRRSISMIVRALLT
jgi:hypothetical protein